MIRIEGEIAINRPVEEVFDFVADERNEPRYNSRIRRVEKLVPGPIGLGTRFQAETKTIMGRPQRIAIEYTIYERPRRLASSIQISATEIQGTLTFDPVTSGTRMRWCWDMRLGGLLRLLTPVIAGTGRRQEQATWAGLKQLMERRRDLVGEAR
jgi:hypothetical protein